MNDDAIEKIFGPVRHLRYQSGPVRLSEEYRRRVEAVDALPQNQSGADKTWVYDSIRRFRLYFSRVERIR